MRSHSLPWTLVPVLALLIYAATWPFVELHYVNSLHQSPAMPRMRIDGPLWIVWFYTPMNLLRDSNAGQNPFGRYWDWCEHQWDRR